MAGGHDLASSNYSLIEGLLSIVENGDTSQATQAMSDTIDGSSGLQLAFIDGDGNFNQSRCLGVDPVVEMRLATEFNTPEKNPVVARMNRVPFGRFTDIRDFVDMPTYQESEFYHEMLKPREPARVAMMVVPGQAGMLSLGLEQDQEASIQQAQSVAWFAGQIHRALGLWYASQSHHQSAFLIDESGVPMGISGPQIDQASLGTLTTAGPGRPVKPCDPGLGEEFGSKFKLALKGFASTVFARGETGPCRIHLEGALTSTTNRAVSVEVTRLQMRDWTPASLRSVYGLTPREASVTLGLLAGKNTSDIAAELGLSIRSVRTYLGAILAKTQTEGQVQLVGKLLGSG